MIKLEEETGDHFVGKGPIPGIEQTLSTETIDTNLTSNTSGGISSSASTTPIKRLEQGQQQQEDDDNTPRTKNTSTGQLNIKTKKNNNNASSSSSPVKKVQKGATKLVHKVLKKISKESKLKRLEQGGGGEKRSLLKDFASSTTLSSSSSKKKNKQAKKKKQGKSNVEANNEMIVADTIKLVSAPTGDSGKESKAVEIEVSAVVGGQVESLSISPCDDNANTNAYPNANAHDNDNVNDIAINDENSSSSSNWEQRALAYVRTSDASLGSLSCDSKKYHDTEPLSLERQSSRTTNTEAHGVPDRGDGIEHHTSTVPMKITDVEGEEEWVHFEDDSFCSTTSITSACSSTMSSQQEKETSFMRIIWKDHPIVPLLVVVIFLVAVFFTSSSFWNSSKLLPL